MFIKKLMLKSYYKKFGSVGVDALIPLRSSKRINDKKYIFVGDYCSIGPGGWIDANKNGIVRIEDGSIIAPNVTILTRSHNYQNDLTKVPYDEKYITGDVIIESGVWIGQNTIILPGCHIGQGAIVGAGSVVTKSIPEYAVCAGNPARVVRYRDKNRVNELIENKCFTNKIRGNKSYIIIKNKDYIE